MSLPTENIQQVYKISTSEETGLHAAGQFGDIDFDYFGAGIGLSMLKDNPAELEYTTYQHQLRQQFLELAEFDRSSTHDTSLDVACPAFQPPDDDQIVKTGVTEPLDAGPTTQQEGRTTEALPPEWFHILRKYRTKDLKSTASASGSDEHRLENSSAALSTEAIIELASENFIQFTSNEFSGNSLLGLSEEDLKGVKLIQDILCCAKRVSEKQYEDAINLLHDCHASSSAKATPVQRLVFYFVEALVEKIGYMTGRIALNDSRNKNSDPLEALKWPSAITLTIHKTHPLGQIPQFSGAQAVIDHVGEAGKIHIVDLEIRTGLHSVILMQALASQRETTLQRLRITAVGTKSKWIMEETGKRLMSFAQSLNLEFSFNVVMVEDMLDLNENLLKVDADEAVAVYAMYALSALIGRSDRLQNVFEVIKCIHPRVMIVSEIEGELNSSNFVGRFVEALFYFGAFFDSLADCMKNNENIREEFESACVSWSIRNILAEGAERKITHVGINAWRKCFEHHGLVEVELSKLCLCHASLVLKRYACQSSFTLAMDGKCLAVGWNGTPLATLSVWKFK